MEGQSDVLLAPTNSDNGRRFRNLLGRAGAQVRAGLLEGLPTTHQRIAVTSATGGAGRSVVAAGIALALAAHRQYPVSIVDGSDMPAAALADRLSVPQGPTVAAAHDVASRARSVFDMERVSRRVEVDQHRAEPSTGVVHALPSTSIAEGRTLAPSELAELLASLRALYPTTVIDCAVGMVRMCHQAVLPEATGLVVVTRARADDIRRTAAVVHAMRRLLPGLIPARVVAVVTASVPGRWPREAAAAEAMLSAVAATACRVPWDDALAVGAPVSQADRATATAMEVVAASVIAAHMD